MKREEESEPLTAPYFRGKWPPRAPEWSTGSKKLDSLLDGYKSGGVCLVFGPGSSGKSQLLFSLSARYAISGRKVLFVDTQRKFRPERVLEIAKSVSPDSGDPLSQIDVLSSDSPERIRTGVVKTASSGGYSLILLDDLSEPYLRGGYSARSTSLLALTLRWLSVWSVVHGRRVIVAERIRYDMVTKTQRPLGIDFTCPYISCFLRLQRRGDDIFYAEDLFSQKGTSFRVTREGVCD